MLSVAARVVRRDLVNKRKVYRSEYSSYFDSRREISYVVNEEGRLYFLMDHNSANCALELPVVKEQQKVKILSKLSPSEISGSVEVEDTTIIAKLVNDRYDESSNSNFVGGMGESDPGVWFTCVNGDETLNTKYIEDIKQIISEVKEHRHGVPFGIHTSGTGGTDIQHTAADLKGLGVDTCEVSLGAVDPINYAKVMAKEDDLKGAHAQFGEVCSFIVVASESGFPIEVGVCKEYFSSAQDLATSLGAVKVNPY